jgi:hypothetical protein
LWAREYEKDDADILNLQSEVARAVADEIRIQLTPEEQTGSRERNRSIQPRTTRTSAASTIFGACTTIRAGRCCCGD